jgi:hypothetical protein
MIAHYHVLHRMQPFIQIELTSKLSSPAAKFALTTLQFNLISPSVPVKGLRFPVLIMDSKKLSKKDV